MAGHLAIWILICGSSLHQKLQKFTLDLGAPTLFIPGGELGFELLAMATVSFHLAAHNRVVVDTLVNTSLVLSLEVILEFLCEHQTTFSP